MVSIFSEHKLALIGIVVLVAGGIWFGMSSSPASPDLVTVTVGGTANPIEQSLVTALLTFRSVELDPKILNSAPFISLRDFSTQIIPEPIGRENPFAPLTTQSVVSPTSTSSAVILKPR